MENNNICIVCKGMLNKNRRYPGLLSCKQCNFLTADISISDIDLKSLYGEDYFHGIEYADYIKEMNSLQTNFKKRLNTLLAYIQYPAKSKLFEIGCAYGFFLDVARHQFRSVEGIDISEKPTLYARNVLRLNASQLNSAFLSASAARGKIFSSTNARTILRNAV